MKKIILISLFGLMFSQTELTTRVYELNLNFDGGYEHQIDLYDLTGIDFDYAIIKVVKASNFYVNSGGATLRVKTPSSYNSYLYLEYGNVLDLPYEIGYIKDTSSNLGADWGLEVTNQNNTIIGDIDLLIAITAEFPIEDTGYIEEGFDFCLHSGQNLVSFPCENSVSIETAIPELAQAELVSIIGEGVAAINLNGNWVGGLSDLNPGSGYWFKTNSNMCFNYTCAE